MVSKKYVLAVILASLTIVLSTTLCIALPFSCDEVVSMLGKVDEKEIIKLIELNKINFDMAGDNIVRLVDAKASSTLIRVLQANRFKENTFRIVSPQEGAPVGKFATVELSGDVPSDRFLWVFIHRKGLRAWWPQQKPYDQPAAGRWEIPAYIGIAEDVGSEFDIKAICVNAADNVRIEEYSRNAETNMHPGMALPQGEPVASVRVKKTGH